MPTSATNPMPSGFSTADLFGVYQAPNFAATVDVLHGDANLEASVTDAAARYVRTSERYGQLPLDVAVSVAGLFADGVDSFCLASKKGNRRDVLELYTSTARNMSQGLRLLGGHNPVPIQVASLSMLRIYAKALSLAGSQFLFSDNPRDALSSLRFSEAGWLEYVVSADRFLKKHLPVERPIVPRSNFSGGAFGDILSMYSTTSEVIDRMLKIGGHDKEAALSHELGVLELKKARLLKTDPLALECFEKAVHFFEKSDDHKGALTALVLIVNWLYETASRDDSLKKSTEARIKSLARNRCKYLEEHVWFARMFFAKNDLQGARKHLGLVDDMYQSLLRVAGASRATELSARYGHIHEYLVVDNPSVP